MLFSERTPRAPSLGVKIKSHDDRRVHSPRCHLMNSKHRPRASKCRSDEALFTLMRIQIYCTRVKYSFRQCLSKAARDLFIKNITRCAFIAGFFVCSSLENHCNSLRTLIFFLPSCTREPPIRDNTVTGNTLTHSLCARALLCDAFYVHMRAGGVVCRVLISKKNEFGKEPA
jgi:hypothetical protein